MTDMSSARLANRSTGQLTIDDRLLAEARRLSRIEKKTALVHAELEALIARESARRLRALGGTEPGARRAPRRRSRRGRSA
jgi:Arc/MetJ family transcription regulator